MSEQKTNIDEILGSILRGAAKLLGCNSANFIVINENTREIGVRVGTVAVNQTELSGLEDVSGLAQSLQESFFPIEVAEQSLIYLAWRTKTVMETTSLGELAKAVFPEDILKLMSEVIGEHRFIIVPVLTRRRNYGVLVFEKRGAAPFSPQQREVMLRYARRIGEIIENDLRAMDFGGKMHQNAGRLLARLIYDQQGTMLNRNVSNGKTPLADLLPTELLAALPGWVRETAAVGDATPRLFDFGQDGEARISIEVATLEMDEGPRFLCTIVENPSSYAAPLPSQLLQMALGEMAPAVMVDPEFRITSCNSAMEVCYGYPPEFLVGREIDLLFQEGRNIRTVLDHRFLLLSDGYFEEGSIIRRKDGSFMPSRIEALLLADQENRVLGYLVMIRPRESDAAEDTQDAATRMMRQERLATMGEMAAQLAHEIRNPLLAIAATLESIGEDLEDAPQIKNTLGGLANEIGRLDMILKDYLSLAARHNASVSRVDLGAVVNDVKRLLDGTRKMSGKRIVTEIPPGFTVLGDAESLKHVFFNVVLNALEATPKGGTVTCLAGKTLGGISVIVLDEGPGLSVPVHDCFKPFFTTKKNGTGLGLSVCHQIVTAHGGTITLRNRESGGCEAVVLLPEKAG